MHTQLALAMSEMPKQHQEKKGCDESEFEFGRFFRGWSIADLTKIIEKIL